MLGLRILCVCGSRRGVWKVTFIARAVLLGGTFSFCDIRRTDDLPVTSGGENRKPQFSVLLSPVTFSSLKICTLILPATERRRGNRKHGVREPVRPPPIQIPTVGPRGQSASGPGRFAPAPTANGRQRPWPRPQHAGGCGSGVRDTLGVVGNGIPWVLRLAQQTKARGSLLVDRG